MKRLIIICLAAGLMVFTTSVAYAAIKTDDFNDNSRNTSVWNLYQGFPDVWLDETNQRLEMYSTTSANDAALYFANNWGFQPTDDFSLKVDFHYDSTGPRGSDACVRLGLYKDWDNYLEVAAGCWVGGETFPYFYYEVTDDSKVEEEGEKARGTDDGTLYISYDAAADELYLSDTGYGAGNAWVTIPGLLQGKWGGDIVGPFLSGWSRGVSLGSSEAYLSGLSKGGVPHGGEAWLDNFEVTSVPEPATICLLGLGGLALLRRGRK